MLNDSTVEKRLHKGSILFESGAGNINTSNSGDMNIPNNDLQNSIEEVMEKMGEGVKSYSSLHRYRQFQNDIRFIPNFKFNKKFGFEFSHLNSISNEKINSIISRDIPLQGRNEFNVNSESENITIILPAYNEEVSIGSIVLQAKKYASRVIVIDDGSVDHTSEIAEMAGAEVISHSKNLGKGVALKTGFEAAAKNGTKIIVTMDADGQHNPSDISKLISPILIDEADMVNGSRYFNGNGKNTPSYRRIGQIVLDKVTSINSGLKISDSQSGFRAFAVHTLPSFRFKQVGFGIESEMLADAANAKLRLKEVEIGVRYDVDCSTEHPLSHGLKVLVKILQDMEFNRPLYYFTVPGMVMFGIGIVMGLLFLRDFYLGANLHFGPTLLMILMTLVGTFMAFTGIMLHSISKLINDSKIKSQIA